ncbi:unnamed protein product [Toxocara canis]|uniref:Pancreas transcription factor 1 subunit alpha n=1 Tax=Toxocara canis TaxID=6265 RepID=A0A183UAK4_TOXCA|nr:unnamed protein product [Toxocara canis]
MMPSNDLRLKQIYADHILDRGYCDTLSATQRITMKRRKLKSDEVLQRQRTAANERERKRMCSINKGFDKLRLRLPMLPYEKKLSKVDTLKQAISYIQQLSTMLCERDQSIKPEDQIIASQPPPTLIISSANGRFYHYSNAVSAGMLAVSWSRTPDKYGSAIRDERGVAHAQCAKVWVPGI